MKESVIHINRLRRVELILALFLPMLLMTIMDVAVVGKMFNDSIKTAKASLSSSAANGDRKLSCFRAKNNARGGNSGGNGNGKNVCPTEKDYALAENGEVTALASTVNNHHNNSSRGSLQSGPDNLNNCNGLKSSTAAKAGGGSGIGSGIGSSGHGSRGAKGGGDHKENETGEEEQKEADDEEARLIDLNREKTLSTVMCVVLGLVFIGLTLPSAYLRARMSFAEQKGRFPLTMYEVNLMRVFEKVYQFNGVYKVLIYALFLPSFRRAVWFVTKKMCSCVAMSCGSSPVRAPV